MGGKTQLTQLQVFSQSPGNRASGAQNDDSEVINLSPPLS